MSHRVLNLLPNAVSQEPDRVLHGIVSTNQPAPKNFTDPLYVVVPDWSPDHYYVINDWPALHGATLPPAGNEVMLSTDSRGNMRCVWWSGTRTTEPLARVVPSVQKGLVVDLDWGISSADQTQEMAEITASKARWVQIAPTWAVLEPSTKGVFDFQGGVAAEDKVISLLAAANVGIIAELDSPPSWANGGRDTQTPPLSVQDYADYVTFAVHRWKTQIKHWHIWNEPDLAQFWKPAPDPAAYAALLKAGYTAAKAADPACVVLMGGLSRNDATFLDALYAAAPDIGSYFDVINTHPYTAHGQAPEVTYADTRPVWSFESDTVGGNPAGFAFLPQGGAPAPTTAEVSNTWANSGSQSVHIVTGAMASPAEDTVIDSDPLAVSAGRTYTGAAAVNVVSGAPSLSVYAQVDWYDGGTYLSSIGDWSDFPGAQGLCQVSVTGTAPPTATSAHLLIGGTGTGVLDFYVDDVTWWDHSTPISADCFTGYKELARIVTAHGRAKPVWITEFGWSTCTPPDPSLGGVSDEKQADFTRRAYTLMRADRLRGEVYPEVALVYALRQTWTGPESPDDWVANLSLVRFDFGEKPAYAVFLEELPGDVLV